MRTRSSRCSCTCCRYVTSTKLATTHPRRRQARMGTALTDSERRPREAAVQDQHLVENRLAAQGTRRWPLLGCDGLAAGIEHSHTAQAFLGGAAAWSLDKPRVFSAAGLTCWIVPSRHRAPGHRHRGHHCVHPARLCSEILVHRVPFRAPMPCRGREPSKYSRESRPCNRDRTSWRLRQCEA